MSKDSNAHVLDDAWVLQVTEAKGFGKGMSKAQKIAIAPAVVSAIVRSASKRAKRIDAHAPLSDPLTAHVIGETTLGERIKDFAKDAGLTLSPGMSKTLICQVCSSEVARDGNQQKMCPPCAKAKIKARDKARQGTPEKKARMKAWSRTPEVKAKIKAWRSTPEGKAKVSAYRSTPEEKTKAKAYNKAWYEANKKARVDTKEALATSKGGA